jgi:hypothetical protein
MGLMHDHKQGRTESKTERECVGEKSATQCVS